MTDVRIKIVREIEMVIDRDRYLEEWTNDEILNAERLNYEGDPEEWMLRNFDDIVTDDTTFSIRED